MHCAVLEAETPRLLGQGCSPFGSRIISLQVSTEAELLVCGDQLGNIIAFKAPRLTVCPEGDCA